MLCNPGPHGAVLPSEHRGVGSDIWLGAERGFVPSEDFHNAFPNVTSSNTGGSAVNSHFENTGRRQLLHVFLLV